MTIKRRASLLASCALALGIGAAQAAEGWTEVHPGGETQCATGTPYSFHTRRTSSSNLLIFFNGGGACWNGVLCDPSSEPTPYVPATSMSHNKAASHSGLFDLDNPENPVRDWNMVFVGYCTGDVHLGSQTVTYDKPDGSRVEIAHQGFANASAALDWTYEAVEAPETVFVAGSSAGSIAAPFYASLIADHYPDARIVQLGDGAGGYAGDGPGGLLEAWGFLKIAGQAFGDAPLSGFNSIYQAAKAAHPDMLLAHYDAASDKVQNDFSALLGDEGRLPDTLWANRADLSASIEDFTSFTAGGDVHTILRSPLLYTYRIGNTRFVDWLRAYLDGDSPVPAALSCQDQPDGCAAPEVAVSGD